MRFQITVDCADPAALVAFWSAALGYAVEPPPAGHATWREHRLAQGVPEAELGDADCADAIVDPSGAGPRIRFRRVPERKTVRNRLRLDLGVGGASPLVRRQALVDAEVARLVGLGATVLGRVPAEARDHDSVVLADPEGNELCVG